MADPTLSEPPMLTKTAFDAVKTAALLLPIAAFFAAGLEHSVANMYPLPYAFFIQGDHAGYNGCFPGPVDHPGTPCGEAMP